MLDGARPAHLPRARGAAQVEAGRTVPAAYRGAWGPDEPGGDGARIILAGDRVTDDDGRGWAVTNVVDSDGVLVIRGLALDDGGTRGDWTIALDPDGDLLLPGSPDSLPRLHAG